jgi:hypothetical protein
MSEAEETMQRALRVVEQVSRIQIFASEYISETAAAEYLKIEPRTLRLWRQTRGIPHFKPTSKVVLYRRADIDEWDFTF